MSRSLNVRAEVDSLTLLATSVFQQAIATGGQISGHTWSHPYMTTMTDMQVLGELGWTSQIIYDVSLSARFRSGTELTSDFFCSNLASFPASGVLPTATSTIVSSAVT